MKSLPLFSALRQWFEPLRQARDGFSSDRALAPTRVELEKLQARNAFLLELNQRFTAANSEAEIAALLLRLPSEIAPAVVGATLVRFDEHSQPRPVESRGQLDEALLAEWHRHLSSQSVRGRCGVCMLRAAEKGQPCPLFECLPLDDVGGIVCFAVEREGRQFGMVGMFLATGQQLSGDERALLEVVAAQGALALENARLRSHALTTLTDVNETLQLQLDFDGLMARLVKQIVQACDADAGLIFLREQDGALKPLAAAGEWRVQVEPPFAAQFAQGALQEGREPLVANLRGTPVGELSSVLCAPMYVEQDALGAIVLGSHRADAFPPHQVRLVSAVAMQAALSAQNAQLYARLAHQAILAERGRLAREMHDSLAQTLGYLKMRSSQIARWVEGGQTARASEALRELAETANEAYVDLRAALDGLRVPLDAPEGTDLAAQLKRCAADFENQSGIPVTLSLDANPPLAASAQAHLLRIAQESLANVRKHAQARRVQLGLTERDGRAQLWIEDDGKGFDAASEQPVTRHGLRLMRERADLLGAEFQVTSAVGKGTRICIELPNPFVEAS